MNQLLGLLILLFLFTLAGLWLRQQLQRSKVRERVLYGFSETVVPDDIDLSAGDYGLRGSARFFYFLREYLSTSKGRSLMFVVGALMAGGTALMLGKPLQSVLFSGATGGFLVVIIGLLTLYVHKKDRLNAVQMELPNTLETLAAIMEGGSAFEAALGHVLKESDPWHPLYFDLNVMNEAMQRGRRRSEALRLWAARCELAYITDVVAGMIQADQTGGSLGSVMKHHAQSLLRENEAEIQRRAERLPVRMLLPMVTMILPAVMVIAAGPSILRIFQIIEQIIGSGGPPR